MPVMTNANGGGSALFKYISTLSLKGPFSHV